MAFVKHSLKRSNELLKEVRHLVVPFHLEKTSMWFVPTYTIYIYIYAQWLCICTAFICTDVYLQLTMCANYFTYSYTYMHLRNAKLANYYN